MSVELGMIAVSGQVVLARDARVGETYRSRTNLPVVVKEKREDRVVVRSLTTGHDVAVPIDYPLSLVEALRKEAHNGQA